MPDPETRSEDVLLSICIPTKNRLEWVRQTIEGVSGIDHIPFEFVVVDEPNDESGSILERECDCDVQYLQNESNLGFSRSIIRAVEAARGDFVMFLSDEDFVDPDAIPVILDIIRSYPDVSRIIGRTVRKNGDVYVDPLESRDLSSPEEFDSQSAIETFYFTQGHLSSPVIRKDDIDMAHAKTFIETPFSVYIHTVMVTQATLEGTTVYVPKTFSILGDVQISEHHTQSNSAIELRARVEKLLPELDVPKHIRQTLLDSERERAAFIVLTTLKFRPTQLPRILFEFVQVPTIFWGTKFWTSLGHNVYSYVS